MLDGQIPKGGTRNVLRDELASIRADLPPEDVVFTHGDYCLPNVMILKGHLSGYIDWGYAGIGDRYLDKAVHGGVGEDLLAAFGWGAVVFKGQAAVLLGEKKAQGDGVDPHALVAPLSRSCTGTGRPCPLSRSLQLRLCTKRRTFVSHK